MPIQWTKDLSTGINELDHQHQGLFVMVGALQEAIRANRLDRVADTIRFLERYAVEHFATEERYMRAHGYPNLPEHRAAHLEFVAEFRRHGQLLASKGLRPLLVVEMFGWLRDWLAEHVRSADGEVARHFAGVGVRPPGWVRRRVEAPAESRLPLAEASQVGPDGPAEAEPPPGSGPRKR